MIWCKGWDARSTKQSVMSRDLWLGWIVKLTLEPLPLNKSWDRWNERNSFSSSLMKKVPWFAQLFIKRFFVMLVYGSCFMDTSLSLFVSTMSCQQKFMPLLITQKISTISPFHSFVMWRPYPCSYNLDKHVTCIRCNNGIKTEQT